MKAAVLVRVEVKIASAASDPNDEQLKKAVMHFLATGEQDSSVRVVAVEMGVFRRPDAG